MKRQTLSLTLWPVLAAACFCSAFVRPALSSPVSHPPAVEVAIKGQNCQVLKDFFGRFEQDRTNKVPNDEVKQVLLDALPEAYKESWAESLRRTGAGSEGPAAITVRVLYVEGRKEDKPIRALITFTLLTKTEESPDRRYDEKLAALVVHRDAALLSIMEQAKNREETRLIHILQEKEVKIGGKSIVGLNFTASNESPPDGGSWMLTKEESINFYLFGDRGIKFVGSVLKNREESAPEGAEGTKVVYSGAIVFKKDLKGNIIGILSPYAVTRDGKRVEKGMVRYDWDADKEIFTKE